MDSEIYNYHLLLHPHLSHGDEGGTLLSSWSLSLQEVVFPESNNENIRGLLQEVNHRVVERILILV